MTLRTLFFTLMLFTCVILMVLSASVFTTVQSIDRADTATQLAGPTSQSAQATILLFMPEITMPTLSLEEAATSAQQFKQALETATQRAIMATPVPYSVQTSRAAAAQTLFAEATRIIHNATQTVEAEKTLTRTP